MVAISISAFPIFLILSCLSTSCLAQSQGQSLSSVLSSTPELSTLYSLLLRYPTLLENLPTLGGTLLAPSNDALTAALNSQREGAVPLNITSPEVVESLVSYHLLRERVTRETLSVVGGKVADTALVNDTFANLDGNPNVVFGSAFGSTGQESGRGDVKIYSGIGEEANIVGDELNFEGGNVLVVDRVLNFPRNCTQTTIMASLTTLVSAFRASKLWATVDSTPKFTCFAPSNEAFAAAGIDLESLSPDETADILKYHSLVGEVGYSTSLEDGKEYKTMLGPTVKVSKREGKMYVNDVEVERGNVIMSNGVAHVLSGVLVPPGTATIGSGANNTAGGGSPTTTTGGQGSNSARSSAFINSRDISLLLGTLLGSLLLML